MEDAEKRSGRLKAMRAIASAQAETCNNNVETSAVPGLLANPLLENPATQPAQEELSATPRFDFYTDPSAAFSANRKRTATANQVARGLTPPNNISSTPQFSSSPRPGQRIPEVTPSSAYQMLKQLFTNKSNAKAIIHPIRECIRGKDQITMLLSTESQEGAGHPLFQVMEAVQLVQEEARDTGITAQVVDRVVEEGEHLKPVLWRGGLGDLGNNLNGPVSSNSWLPKSISVKKPKMSESSTKSTSGQSLAEYLSAAFTEAANDEPNV
ncbi:hypothetical protein OIU77_025341 [Salix suchowensis]|uniref:Uncharacterized protein n=1 Tax=Salix suchowensis TaxID=1278906 RepID=A0ABQ9BVZ6_9ROSI|nr:hypothetical protein OIU77_025341 [Salix suchowensis]